MKIVNLIGFPLTVGSDSTVSIPVGTHRAFAPTIYGGEAEPIDVEGIGAIPTVYPADCTLNDCWIESLADRSRLPFPSAVEGVIYLAPFPVKVLAQSEGRSDVWGMGDHRIPGKPSEGVKTLVRA
jgi:hypothetical protein